MQYRKAEKVMHEAGERSSDSYRAMWALYNQMLEAVLDGRFPETLMRAYTEAHKRADEAAADYEAASIAFQTAYLALQAQCRAEVSEQWEAHESAAKRLREADVNRQNASDARRAAFTKWEDTRKAFATAARMSPDDAEPLAEAYRSAHEAQEAACLTDAAASAAWAEAHNAERHAQSVYEEAHTAVWVRWQKANP